MVVFRRRKVPGASYEDRLSEIRTHAQEEGTGAQAGPRLPAHPRGNRERDAGAAVAAPLPGLQRDPAVLVPPPPPPPAGAARCCAADRLPAPWTAAGTGADAPRRRGSVSQSCCLPSSWVRPESVRRRVRDAAAQAAAAATAGARTPT